MKNESQLSKVFPLLLMPNAEVRSLNYFTKRNHMAEVKVYYDQVSNTLTVWFDTPQGEYISEETGDEVILMKDNQGQVIGFEKLNYTLPSATNLKVSFETATA
jgi:uncharacterized protein YuzE